MYGKRYNRDPKWLTVKYACKCDKCGKSIKPGDRGFYYPSDKSMFCEGDECGASESRQFESMAFDESMYSGQW